MSEWQPIATAPKDGTDILVLLFGNSMQVVFFDDEHRDSEYPWQTMDGPGYHLDAPTHWMPLPDPPNN